MIFAGMAREGIESVRNVRARYDGERRNPWNEPECGQHYARAMSSWSTLLAASGFRYHGAEQAVTIKAAPGVRCFSGLRITGRTSSGSIATRSSYSRFL